VRDRPLAELRQVAPVAVARRDRRGEAQLGGERPRRHEAPDRFDQRHVADEGRRVGPFAVRAGVADRDRLQDRLGLHCALEERPVERIQRAPVGRRPLGEDRDHAAARQRARHAVADAPGVPPVAALDEQRAGALAEPPDDRPVENVVLGDEHRRADGENRHDVEPRDVIGDEHAPRRQARGLVEADHPHI